MQEISCTCHDTTTLVRIFKGLDSTLNDYDYDTLCKSQEVANSLAFWEKRMKNWKKKSNELFHSAMKIEVPLSDFSKFLKV